MPTLHIIYASTSGHTEHVVEKLCQFFKSQGPSTKYTITLQRAEQAEPADLLKSEVLILASGTWNTGGIEGQLNPHMHLLLKEKGATMDLKGQQVAVIGLGDSRYRYTAKAMDRLVDFVKHHNGRLMGEPLRIVNEPYGQEAKVEEWAQQLISHL